MSKELQNQALQLSIADRWRLVESLLSSIKQEPSLSSPKLGVNVVESLDPWTQSLLGVIELR